LLGKKGSWEERLNFYKNWDPSQAGEDIPPFISLSCPEELYQAVVRTYGEKQAFQILFDSNFPAPTYVRVNTLKTTREKLLALWKDFAVKESPEAPNAILFEKKTNFFSLPEFKSGYFEVQDAASQLVGELVDPKPGDHVMDFCSGSGGKTLAFAPKMEGKGQIYLHDIRKGILIEAKKRLARAGVQNAQILQALDESKMKKLKKKMDWVLVDAPCTGTGTYRRNPCMKYHYSSQMLERLTGQQRVIFERALSFLKPGGSIVYATCSLLKEENENQVEHFIKTYNLKLKGSPFKSIPALNSKDGLFGAVLKYED
jgi:16S rRNA C967 or C1407 C5-methylase (RsmB/RsmF family)